MKKLTYRKVCSLQTRLLMDKEKAKVISNNYSHSEQKLIQVEALETLNENGFSGQLMQTNPQSNWKQKRRI